MKKPKVTPWFPHEIKPVHVGVYQIKNKYLLFESVRYAYWNGKIWSGFTSAIMNTPDDVLIHDIGNQEKVWRGMAVKP